MALVGLQYEPVSSDVNEVCFEEEQDIPNTREKSVKSQALVNDLDLGNEAECTQLLSTCVATKLKFWVTFSYWIRHTTVGMWSPKEYNSPATLLILNTCTDFRTCYRVPEADLRLLQLLKWGFL